MKKMFVKSSTDGVLTGALITKVAGYYMIGNEELATHLVEATNSIGTKNNLYKLAYREYNKRTWLYDSPYGVQLLVLRALWVYEKKYGLTHYVPNFNTFEVDPDAPGKNPYVKITMLDDSIIHGVSKALRGFHGEYMIDGETYGLPWTTKWGSVINDSIEWNTNHLVFPVYLYRVLAGNRFKSPTMKWARKRNRKYFASLLIDFAQTLTASIATCINGEIAIMGIQSPDEVLDKYIDRIYFLINQAIKGVVGPSTYQEEEF